LWLSGHKRFFYKGIGVMGHSGLERLEEVVGIGGRRRKSGEEVRWWATLDSNQRPQSYQDCALTN
jgi:hypothetical protein